MPRMSSLGTGRLRPMGYYTVYDDQRFIIIGPELGQRAYNVQYGKWQGDSGWIAIECRAGDRRVEDGPYVDRVGLDGWVDMLPQGNRKFIIDFSTVFDEGCFAEASPYNWFNFFELHAHPIKGVVEVETAGPLMLTLEYNQSMGGPCFRVVRGGQTYDPNGLATGQINGQFIFQADQWQNQAFRVYPNIRYDWRVEYYANDEAGYIRVWKDGVQIVDYNGAVGFGLERRIYPAFRVYRATRQGKPTLPTTAKYLVKIHEISAVEVPYPPGVTRGPEMINDGKFNVNLGRWRTDYSDPGCEMFWESDGWGGGWLRSKTRQFSHNDTTSNARIRRRLDILEPGKTYELRHTGSYGLGAASTDGGYFAGSDPATRYLTVTSPPGGGELVRQFVAHSETLFLGNSNSYDGLILDEVSLKLVIPQA